MGWHTRLFVTLMLLAATSGAALAVPSEITYMGRLVAATGRPAEGEVALTVAFYGEAEGGDALGDKTFPFTGVKLANGVFTLNIALTDAERAAIFTGGDVYIEVTDVTNSKTYQRQKYSSAPYAFRVPTDGSSMTWDSKGKLTIGTVPTLKLKASSSATVALKAASGSADGLSFTLPSSVAAGQFMTVDANGQLSWAAPSGAGDITGVTAGTGLTGGATSGNATLAVDVGTAAGKIMQVQSGGKIPALDGSDVTALNATQLTSGTIPNARFPATLPAASGANLTALNASNLGSGTVPDAVFPATLPAASGANLTNLDATDLTGVVPDASFPATLPAASGANLTNLDATDLTGVVPDASFPATLPVASGANLTNLDATDLSGVVPNASFPATLPAASGANLTALNASNLGSGTVPDARLAMVNTTTTKFSQAYMPDPRSGLYFFDDFLTGVMSGTGATGNANMSWMYTFATTTIAPQATTAGNRPGVIRFTGGTAGTHVASLALGSAAQRSIILDAANSGMIEMEFAVFLPANSGANRGTVRIGLMDTVNQTVPSNGVYVEIGLNTTHTATGYNLGGGTTATTGDTATASGWTRFKIVITNNTSVSFFMNGTLMTGGTITNNIPSAAVAPVVKYQWVAGTAPAVDVDYFLYRQTFGTMR
jgi:hypothetical protein